MVFRMWDRLRDSMRSSISYMELLLSVEGVGCEVNVVFWAPICGVNCRQDNGLHNENFRVEDLIHAEVS